MSDVKLIITALQISKGVRVIQVAPRHVTRGEVQTVDDDFRESSVIVLLPPTISVEPGDVVVITRGGLPTAAKVRRLDVDFELEDAARAPWVVCRVDLTEYEAMREAVREAERKIIAGRAVEVANKYLEAAGIDASEIDLLAGKAQ